MLPHILGESKGETTTVDGPIAKAWGALGRYGLSFFNCHLSIFLRLQIILVAKQKVLAGHDPAGKEMPTHPIAALLVLEWISQFFMTENMDEQFPFWLQPI